MYKEDGLWRRSDEVWDKLLYLGLTAGAIKTYEFLVKYKIEHDGATPTIRQMCKGCNLSTSSLVFTYLRKLQKVGLIETIKGHDIVLKGSTFTLDLHLIEEFITKRANEDGF